MNRAGKRRQQKFSKKAAGNAKLGKATIHSPDQQTLVIQESIDLALQHHAAGRLPEAESIYQQILQADPNQPVALHLLGVIAHQGGKHDTAVDLITKALAISPDSAEAHSNLGLALHDLGELDEAVVSFHKALAIKPDFAEAHYNLGTTLHDLGELDEAAVSYHKALAIKSDYAEAHSNLGIALQDLGELDEAVASFHKALAIKPDYAEAHSNLANALKEQGKLDEAVASFHKALAIKPDFSGAHNNLGNAFKELGKLDEAAASFHKALAIEPDFAEAHNNLGTVLQDLGEPDGAAASYHKALAIKPDYAEAHHNLGLALLLQGNLREGWAEYEWRLRAEEGTRQRPFPQVPWAGQPVDTKTVLVWGEQGVGDEIMFAGMAPDLVEAGATVILEADPRLVPLFRRSFDGVECIAKQDPPAAETRRHGIDFQAPGGNLGRWLRPDLESFPGRQFYLVAEEDRAAALRDRYRDATDDRLIGIAWVSKNKRIGRQKSMTLRELAPLTGIPGVRLIDLQYGDTAEERRQFEDQTGVTVLHDDGLDQMADLDAFAAQVAAMDLVISVSNTTVHMAGALGVPAWVMLNTVPLPCWMLEGDDSPWYPSVRLFRQTEPGEWADVIGRVGDALAALAGDSD